MAEIICEIGKNYIDTPQEEPQDVLLYKAKKLIDEAKKAGCKIVKFQTHDVTDEVHPEAKIIAPHFDQDRYQWVKRNTFPFSFWQELKNYCDEQEMEFMSTPMSKNSAIMLNSLVKRWKIGSADILDFVMLDFIRNTGKPVIMSSGMSSLEELRKAYNYLAEKVEDITILHCVSLYPCPVEKLNLGTITFLKKEFPKAKIGFSDHSIGIDSALMAINLEAEIIEKHFSFNRNAWGSDHKVSLLPNEMEELCRAVHFGVKEELDEKVLGVETKYLREEEQKFRPIFRKGLFASNDIPKGKILTESDFYALRPYSSIPSEEYPNLLGTKAKRDFVKYESFE